jgi:hypothetical protein
MLVESQEHAAGIARWRLPSAPQPPWFGWAGTLTER